MKKIISLLLCISLVLSCTGTIFAHEEFGKKKSYIVVLEAPAVYSPDRVTFYSADDDMYREALLELQAEVRAQIDGGVSLFSLRGQERTYSYTDVINGFTVNVDTKTAEKIKSIDGVAGVYEDEIIDIVKPAEAEMGEKPLSTDEVAGDTTQLSAANSGNMINVQSAYDKGYNGQGRAVAVIDSNINPAHKYYTLSDNATAKYTQGEIAEILGNNTMKVSATAANAYRNAKIPYAFNYPQNSPVVTGPNLHGAHVSGIVAGNSVKMSDGVIRGIAPEAQILFFGMYHPDGTPTSAIVAALDDAVKFDVDAINISMGADFASENNPSAVALWNAVKSCRNAGISVVFAAGNADRISYSTSMSDYGASDNRAYKYSSKVGSVQAEYAYMNYLEDSEGNKYPCVPKGKTEALDELAVVDCGNGTQAEIDAAGVSGKIALITMPDPFLGGGYAQAAARAMNAKAVAVVMGYNSDDLPDGSSNYAYPLFLVSKSSAGYIKENVQNLKYTGERTIIQREDAPRENTFSSYGYGDNLDISVDFAAPGGNIFSSYGGAEGYTNLSGTSMAAPHVTGATSLMYQCVEEKFPAYEGANKVMLVKNLLASTAESVYTENGALSSPRKVGAGIIQLDKAMETKVVLRAINSSETKINLGAELGKSFSVTFNVFNLSSEAVTFNNIDVDVSSDDYKYYEGRGYGYYGRKKLDAAVSGAASVTVPANRSRTVTVNITLSNEDISYLQTAMTNGFFVDGKVTLTGSTNCDVGIPFSGFYGDWGKLPIMNINRVLDNMYVFGVADDGFSPDAMITKNESGELVMPIADTVDETISGLSVVMAANPLRNAYLTAKVDGTTVINNGFLNKEYNLGYYLGNMMLGDLSSVSEITVTLNLPYYINTNGKSKSFTIKMVKDNTPPVISDMYVSDGGKTANVAVSDEYGVSAVSAYGLLGEEWKEDHKYIKKKSATAEFDITDLDELNYFVYDCAFNMVSFEPHISIDVKDGMAQFANNKHRSLPANCMIAVYENGKMTEFRKLSEENCTLDAYDTKEFDISEYIQKEYKLFFWGEENGVRPLCDAYYIK